MPLRIVTDESALLTAFRGAFRRSAGRVRLSSPSLVAEAESADGRLRNAPCLEKMPKVTAAAGKKEEVLNSMEM